MCIKHVVASFKNIARDNNLVYKDKGIFTEDQESNGERNPLTPSCAISRQKVGIRSSFLLPLQFITSNAYY
jgi:hypothetical protein